MGTDPRIIELLTEPLIRQDRLIEEVRGLSEQQAKTNLALGELRLSVMKLADEINVVHDLEHRGSMIEKQLRNGS